MNSILSDFGAVVAVEDWAILGRCSGSNWEVPEHLQSTAEEPLSKETTLNVQTCPLGLIQGVHSAFTYQWVKSENIKL